METHLTNNVDSDSDSAFPRAVTLQIVVDTLYVSMMISVPNTLKTLRHHRVCIIPQVSPTAKTSGRVRC